MFLFGSFQWGSYREIVYKSSLMSIKSVCAKCNETCIYLTLTLTVFAIFEALFKHYHSISQVYKAK